ncbi:MAG: cell division protein FtsW [Clostridia bacterium]|nr:cell division protein FtsW [Clostridia bacterium]
MLGFKRNQTKPAHKSARASAKNPIKELFHLLVSADGATVHRVRGGIDKPFFVLVIILICLGSIAVSTAGYVYARERSVFGYDSFYFIKKQVVWAALALAAMFGMSLVDYGFLKKMALPITGVAVVLLLLVFVPGIGVSANGARRWIDIGIQFQPSEIAKLALVMLLSLYISKTAGRAGTFKYGVLYPASLVVFFCGLVALEKHMSATIILFLLGASMIFIAGVEKRWIAAVSVTGALGASYIIFFTDYTKARVDAWLHPELHLKTGSYQPYEGLLAIGSGGFFGTGLTGSIQKYMWLPEPYNDFIYAIWCEELGFVGAVGLVVLFMLLAWRGFTIARKAPDVFSAMLVTGLTLKVTFQAMLNIAVVTSIIPTTGIALPFFSYGGTALVMQLAEMGIILSISRYSSGEKQEIKLTQNTSERISVK